MAVYREAFHIKAQIEKQSTQIFNDAADFGAPVKHGDYLWKATNQLASWYGDKETRNEARYSTGRSVSIEVTMIDEWAVSDERKSYKDATEIYDLSFVSCTTGKCKGYDGYVTISRKNGRS